MRTESLYEYEAFIADYYDSNPVVLQRGDIRFFLDLARESGGPVLELGCGTGRVLLPIAEAGIRIVGLDLSERMLARCREKLQNKPAEVRQRVHLVHASMTDFELGEKFRLITTPFRSFQHLRQTEDQVACLEAAARHIVPNGRLVLDLFHTDPRRMHDPAFQQETQALPEVEIGAGKKLRLTERTVAFHRSEQVNDVELIYNVTREDGRVERLVQSFSVRYFFRYEVEHLLARCGFRVVSVYGDYDSSPLKDDSREMVFVAERVAA